MRGPKEPESGRSFAHRTMASVSPREIVAEAPLQGTDHRLVVTRVYRRALEHPSEIVSPLQSEFAWSVGLYEGRRREPAARCEIRSWTGEFDGVFPAPDGRRAAVRWNDQTEAGLVLVEVAPDLRQLDAAWDTRATNWLEGPVWWPDSGRLVVVENPEGVGPWWAERGGEYADDEDDSPGGSFTPGSLVVLDRDPTNRHVSGSTSTSRAVGSRPTMPTAASPRRGSSPRARSWCVFPRKASATSRSAQRSSGDEARSAGTPTEGASRRLSKAARAELSTS